MRQRHVDAEAPQHVNTDCWLVNISTISITVTVIAAATTTTITFTITTTTITITITIGITKTVTTIIKASKPMRLTFYKWMIQASRGEAQGQVIMVTLLHG